MKITAIDIYQVNLPVKGGTYRLSGGRTYDSYDSTIVSITTECGLIGWGETVPFGGTYIGQFAGGVRAALAQLAPAILGKDPRQTDRIYDAMDAVLTDQRAAKCAIDVACWDIFGKAAGLPVCDLLGGRVSGPIPLISSIGSDDPDAMRAKVTKHRDQGFMGHSMKVGASEIEGGPALDAERIKAVLSDRRPGEWFLVDANGGLTPEHALRMLALLPNELDFVLEAPCATRRETLSLRTRCSVPILLDELIQTETDVIHAIHTDACDGVGLKISKQGGLTPTMKQRTIAEAAGMVMSIQETTGSDIAFAAILHMAQSTRKNVLRCALDTRSMTTLTTAAFDAPVKHGGASAPNVPGLGIEHDLDVLGSPIAKYRI